MRETKQSIRQWIPLIFGFIAAGLLAYQLIYDLNEERKNNMIWKTEKVQEHI